MQSCREVVWPMAPCTNSPVAGRARWMVRRQRFSPAGIAARTKGPIVWCLTRPDLFFPALAEVGLHADRVIFVESDKEEDVLANMEEGLSFGGLGAVVGELVRLPMVGSRLATAGGRENRDDGARRPTLAQANGGE